MHHGIALGGLHCDRGLPSALACCPRALLWDLSILSRARLVRAQPPASASASSVAWDICRRVSVFVSLPSPFRTLGREGGLAAGLQRLAEGLRGFVALLTLVWMCGNARTALYPTGSGLRLPWATWLDLEQGREEGLRRSEWSICEDTSGHWNSPRGPCVL